MKIIQIYVKFACILFSRQIHKRLKAPMMTQKNELENKMNEGKCFT